jgi:hypothetical protein
MAIFKSESASQSTEHDGELEQERAEEERAGHEGSFGYGYEDGREPDPDLEGAEAAPQQTTTGAVNRDLKARDAEREDRALDGGATEDEAMEDRAMGEREPAGEEESRATTLSTAEPGATMGRDKTIGRDEATGPGGREPDEIEHSGFGGSGFGGSEMGSRPVGQDLETDRDEELSDDSMSGDAVQTQPQSTPMQPAMAPEAVIAGSPATPPASSPTASTGPTAQSPLTTDPGPVLAPETSLDFRERWHGIQAEFVDDPRRAVEDADRLVADVARAFTAGVEERRRSLTSGWEQDGHGETEELRLAMRQYRALVDHILQD